MLTNAQGEQAHRLVKQLYGTTNKREATKQIGHHVQRLERAKLAADRQRQCEAQTISDNDDIGSDLGAHYQISKSRKDPVSLSSYVHANHGDPAFNVCVCVPL